MGSGDSFAGGVGFGLLHDSTNYINAAQYGNTLGALRTQGITFQVFKPLREVQLIMK
jgi:sugar/nucleoside kinase (ribokinase family)